MFCKPQQGYNGGISCGGYDIKFKIYLHNNVVIVCKEILFY